MIEKILLIDDDEVTLILCEFIIEINGFAKEIVKLNNGLEGLDFFEEYAINKNQGSAEKPPALIFLDLNMPVLNGWDFLEDFSRNYPELTSETKVVILSSTVDPEDYKKAFQYSFVVDFINKPLNDESILKLKANKELQSLFTDLNIAV